MRENIKIGQLRHSLLKNTDSFKILFMIKLNRMKLTNSSTEYGFISKTFHWLSAAVLIIQIPLGFYLVDMDFSERRLTVESIHVTLGLSIFYLTLLRLIYKTLNPTPRLSRSLFTGQKIIAKLNHVFLYIAILTITISGALKKLYNGEELDMFFFNLEIKDNFELAETFYEIHIFGNYTLITLISLHIFAVIVHKLLFKENLLKRIL